MIIEAIIDLICNVAIWFINLLPAFEVDLSFIDISSFTGAIEMLFSSIAYFLPMPLIVVVIIADFGISNWHLIFNNILRIWNFLKP